MKEKIKQYLEETFLFEFNDEITETSDLFKLGIIDSFGYIQLMAYLEDEFHIDFSDEEVLSSKLVSFATIADSVARKCEKS